MEEHAAGINQARPLKGRADYCALSCAGIRRTIGAGTAILPTDPHPTPIHCLDGAKSC